MTRSLACGCGSRWHAVLTSSLARGCGSQWRAVVARSLEHGCGSRWRAMLTHSPAHGCGSRWRAVVACSLEHMLRSRWFRGSPAEEMLCASFLSTHPRLPESLQERGLFILLKCSFPKTNLPAQPSCQRTHTLTLILGKAFLPCWAHAVLLPQPTK